jgi:hypothetical protein
VGKLKGGCSKYSPACVSLMNSYSSFKAKFAMSFLHISFPPSTPASFKISGTFFRVPRREVAVAFSAHATKINYHSYLSNYV